MKNYITFKQVHTEAHLKFKKKYNQISVIRLLFAVTFLISGYYYLKSDEVVIIVSMLMSFVGFILLMKKHQKIAWEIKVKKALIEINTEEIHYLNREKIPFDNGLSYNDFTHFYAHDLDIFGENSLFQNLNRTATYIGKSKLAQLLLTLLPNDRILENQKAIQELSDKFSWRQYVLALAKITEDTKTAYDNLVFWATTYHKNTSKLIQLYSFASPILLATMCILFLNTSAAVYSTIIVVLFILNLMVLGSQKKKIDREIKDSGEIHDILKQYSLIIEAIENEKFESKYLLELQKKLTYKSTLASKQIRELSRLFADMDSIHNVVGLVIFNGFFLYHIHVLRRLLHWKEEHAEQIISWLNVIGEFEALNSLANYSYNNSEFVFPILNDQFKITMHDLGHPLIQSEKRVTNTIDFNANRFVILTGSNMSGKSTFLRTLGINMVLSCIGAPICATKAEIHPLPVLVSMRLSDSLNDSESYFFAEVKRLKDIMSVLKEKVCFVLLDEILRGTNSDDKRSGTIGVVKNSINKGTIGVIATHDLEVCLTTDDYPDILTNKCFEVEIINNDLSFDYKLRDGICKNKSATFLMKKMEII